MIGSLGAVWIAIALVLAVVRRRPALFMLVTAAVLAADMISLGLKELSGRRRPFLENPEQDPLIGTHLDLSFPSGHSATSFAGATVLAAAAPQLAVPLYLLAGAVAWSRVYVGVHYPLDILVGALVGTGVGLILVYLERHRPLPRRRRRPAS